VTRLIRGDQLKLLKVRLVGYSAYLIACFVVGCIVGVVVFKSENESEYRVGKIATYWTAPPWEPIEWAVVDIGADQSISAFNTTSLTLPSSVGRSVCVKVGEWGKDWSTVDRENPNHKIVADSYC